MVGSNGSGKSNCLDSLRFVAESLRTSLDHALRDRGAIKEVRRRSGGHPNHFALREASVHTQILVTSHSPDLLDDADIPTDSILAVDNQEGVTWIAPIDEAGRSALKDRLFIAGELLRQNQLTPDPAARIDDRPLELFDLAGQ